MSHRITLSLIVLLTVVFCVAASLLTLTGTIDTKDWIVVVSGSAVAAVALVLFFGVFFARRKIEPTPIAVSPLAALDATHRLATKGDIDTIAYLLNKRPMDVIVRDLMYGNRFLVTAVAQGPFGIEVNGDERAVVGFDRSGAIAKLRIVEHGVVEIIDGTRPTWTPASMGGIRIYVPK
jgi:hypothetical protein